MLSIDNITVSFGGFTLLSEISFVLNKNERVALVGENEMKEGKITLKDMEKGEQKLVSIEKISEVISGEATSKSL